MMNVPASMRSGMMRCFAPFSLLTPFTRIVGVPAPSILRSHFVEQVGEIGDFGFAGAVLKNRLALGESRSHEQIFGAGDGDFVENNFCAFEASGAGFNVAVILHDLRAKAFEPFDMKVNRARADRAATGERDAGVPTAGNQRSEDQRGRAHGLHQFVGGFGSGERCAVERGAMMGSSVAEVDLGSHGG